MAKQAGKFLTAEWSNLIMANYVVPKEVLDPFVPRGTELDAWQGEYYMSLVGFMFLRTRVLGIPIPFHQNFEEVNLRFYVKHKHEGEWRRGVVFIKEIVPKWAITTVARTVYGEPYATHKMRHTTNVEKDKIHLAYEWKSGDKWNKLAATGALPAIPMEEGSEAEFIAEHYWGYTQLNPRKTSQYEVNHPKWDIYKVLDHDIDIDIANVYGKEFAPYLTGDPASVFIAKGSDIVVRKGKTIKFPK